MKHYTQVNYYDLLEIDPRAAQSEIEAAYQRQLDMVSGNSLATYGLFVGDDVSAIRQRLEAAIAVLGSADSRRAYDLEMFQHSYVSPDAAQASEMDHQTPITAAAKVPTDVAPLPANAPEFPEPNVSAPDVAPAPVEPPPVAPKQPLELAQVDGPSLRAVREQQGLTLEAISARTKIAEYYLQYIEEERFAALPPGIYLRSYLKQYAEAIGVDATRVTQEYLVRREAAQNG